MLWSFVLLVGASFVDVVHTRGQSDPHSNFMLFGRSKVDSCHVSSNVAMRQQRLGRTMRQAYMHRIKQGTILNIKKENGLSKCFMSREKSLTCVRPNVTAIDCLKYGQFSGVFLSENVSQCESNLSLSISQQGATPLVSRRNLM